MEMNAYLATLTNAQLINCINEIGNGQVSVIGQDKNTVRAALFGEYENRFGGEALDSLFERMGM